MKYHTRVNSGGDEKQVGLLPHSLRCEWFRLMYYIKMSK